MLGPKKPLVQTIHTNNTKRKYSRECFSARKRTNQKREDDLSAVTKDTLKTMRSHSQSTRTEDILKV